jgi:hypothetical protein
VSSLVTLVALALFNEHSFHLVLHRNEWMGMVFLSQMFFILVIPDFKSIL